MPKMTFILEAISLLFFLITLSILLGRYAIRTMVWRPRRHHREKHAISHPHSAFLLQFAFWEFVDVEFALKEL